MSCGGGSCCPPGGPTGTDAVLEEIYGPGTAGFQADGGSFAPPPEPPRPRRRPGAARRAAGRRRKEAHGDGSDSEDEGEVARAKSKLSLFFLILFVLPAGITAVLLVGTHAVPLVVDYVAYRGHYNEVKLLYEEYNPEKVSRCAGGRETRGALTPAPREDRGDPGNLEEVQGEGGRAGQEAAPEVQGPLPDKEVPEGIGGARGRRGAVL